MRLFIGVEMEDAVTAAAEGAARGLKDRLESVAPTLKARWIPRANLHITLWFLGEVEDSRTPLLLDRLAAPWEARPFDLQLKGCGGFPPSGAPRVLWIGAERGTAEMRALYAELDARLRPLGFVPEKRPYTPHLTIARVKEAGRAPFRAVREALAADPCACGLTAVRAVTVFRSRLSPQGAAYEPLLRVPLT